MWALARACPRDVETAERKNIISHRHFTPSTQQARQNNPTSQAASGQPTGSALAQGEDSCVPGLGLVLSRCTLAFPELFRGSSGRFSRETSQLRAEKLESLWKIVEF
jgi:hypothetical protein